MKGVPLGYGNYDGPQSERKLTYFTEEQLAVLHAFYARIREHYALRAYRLTKAEVARLARETGLTDQQVRKWYTRQQLIEKGITSKPVPALTEPALTEPPLVEPPLTEPALM